RHERRPYARQRGESRPAFPDAGVCALPVHVVRRAARHRRRLDRGIRAEGGPHDRRARRGDPEHADPPRRSYRVCTRVAPRAAGKLPRGAGGDRGGRAAGSQDQGALPAGRRLCRRLGGARGRRHVRARRRERPLRIRGDAARVPRRARGEAALLVQHRHHQHHLRARGPRPAGRQPDALAGVRTHTKFMGVCPLRRFWFSKEVRMITGKKVAILVAEGFEQVEMTKPREALDKAGAETAIVSPAKDEVQGWNHFDKGDRFAVDVPLEEANADEFDALLLPGGVANPDQLRAMPKAVEFVKRFVDSGKPIGVICHGPWTLIEAGAVKGRTMTSWPTLKTDLMNAGARWVDQEVVTDRGIVSSRKPDDIPAFSRKLIEEIGEGRHAQRRAAQPQASQRAGQAPR